MAARSLRHYKGTVASNVTGTIVPAVAANRALVVSKLTVVPTNVGITVINIFIGDGTNAARVAQYISLNFGEVYTETGVILLAGETLQVFVEAGGQTTAVNVFGEEVDN